MNIYKYILMGCVLAVFVSCATEYNNSPVVGEWKLTAALIENAYDFNNDGEASNNLMTETGCLQNEFIYFDEDYFGEYRFNTRLEIEWDDVNEFYITSCLEETEWPYFVWTYDSGEGSITWQGQGMWGFSFYYSNNTITMTFPDAFEVPVVTSNGSVVMVAEDLTLVYEKI